MAVVTRKSTAIANRDATPTVPVGASIAGGNMRTAEGFITTANGDSAASLYPMVSIPSNARVKAVILNSAAQGGACAINVGVYYPTTPPALSGATPNQVISAAFFAAALSVVAAVTATDITNSSGTNTIALQELELWQAVGLATDPGCNLDITIALTAATAAAAAIGLKVDYVQ